MAMVLEEGDRFIQRCIHVVCVLLNLGRLTNRRK